MDRLRSHRMIGVTLLTFAMACVVGGCNVQPKPGPPPVTFAYRNAQIPTRGLVLSVTNTTADETLDGIFVTVRSQKDKPERSHKLRYASIEPQDSITVGWMELDGWKLQPGDEITLRCRQYVDPKKDTVIKP